MVETPLLSLSEGEVSADAPTSSVLDPRMWRAWRQWAVCRASARRSPAERDASRLQRYLASGSGADHETRPTVHPAHALPGRAIHGRSPHHRTIRRRIRCAQQPAWRLSPVPLRGDGAAGWGIRQLRAPCTGGLAVMTATVRMPDGGPGGLVSGRLSSLGDTFLSGGASRGTARELRSHRREIGGKSWRVASRQLQRLGRVVR